MRRRLQEFYHVDFDTVLQMPIQDMASRLGISFNSKKFCFCPDPGCADHSSKKRSAAINPKNNTIHCFCCGQTWNPYTLAGLVQFGLSPKECYVGSSIADIGRALYHMGVDGITLETNEPEQQKQVPPRMPKVELYELNGTPYTVPLYRCLGLHSNPFSQAYIRTEDDKKESLQLDFSSAARILMEKGLSAMSLIYADGSELDPLAAKERQNVIQRTEQYLIKIQPFLQEEDKESFLGSLTFHYLFTDSTIYQQRLQALFPKETELIQERIAAYESRDWSIESIEEIEQNAER